MCLVKAEKVIASLQHIILNVSLSNALKHPLPRSIIRIRYEKVVNVKFSASSRTIVSYKRVLNIRKSRGKKKKEKKRHSAIVISYQ